MAVSGDGSLVVAGGCNHPIYTSTNFGVTWSTPPWPDPAGDQTAHFWMGIACSNNGVKIVAVAGGYQGGASDYIYTSTNSGATFTQRTSAGQRDWVAATSSSDGTLLAAAATGGFLYTSTDSGVTWTARASSQNWRGIASSSDGTKLVASALSGLLWTSQDAGVTWRGCGTIKTWNGVSMDSSGDKMFACANQGLLFATY